jgi:serine/threonine-protein kinase RsbW
MTHKARIPGDAAQLSEARAWVLGLLPEACPRAADVALVVSELATNALLHSASGAPGGVVDVLVDVEPDAVALAVVDQGPAALAPARRPDGEGGRGLQIVTALADAYEVTTTPEGRTVWCRLDWPNPLKGSL